MASSGAKILVPVITDGGEATQAYLYADDTGAPSKVAADGLLPWVKANLSEEKQAKFKRLIAADGTVPINGTQSAGFTITYDDQIAALHLDVSADAKQTQSLSLTNAPVSVYQTALEPAKHSGFINFRGGQSYVHGGDSAILGRQAARIDLDSAYNYKGWVVEGRTDYLEGDSRPWQRDETRIVHDWPDKMVRFAAGDLSYPVSGFQSYRPMLGVSVARNFTLQPYRVTTPTGRTSFLLQSPSRVDVIVNNVRVRTLQLAPGPYDIADFPVSDGSNDVTLIITDAAGRVERKTFPLVSDQKLLKKGLHEYAYNLGVESTNIARQIEYHFDKPVFSGFHRYGVTDKTAIGSSLQGDEDVQQIGAQLVRGFNIGTFGIEQAASHSKAGTGVATQFSYSYLNSETERSFVTALEYRGKKFGVLGVDPLNPDNNPVAWGINARYTQPMWWDTTMGVGGRYQFARGHLPNEWSYSVDFRRAYGEISTSLSFQHRSVDGMGVFAGITWTPGVGRHSVSSSVDTLQNSKDLNWSWRDDANKWQAGAGVNDTDHQRQGTGNLAYTGYRGEASVRDEVVSGLGMTPAGKMGRHLSDHRTTVNVGTAIAFADDHVALSRPINSGFVLVARHKSLDGHPIGINAAHQDDGGTTYQAQADGMGPAVIPDAVPYMYRPVNIDTTNVPGGYDVGVDNFTIKPTYKSGTVVSVGSSANIYADGYIHLADGNPAQMQAGAITGKDGSTQEFFTNQKGRFRISRLAPGDYDLKLYAYPNAPLSIVIPADINRGKFDAGTLVITEGAAQ